MEETVLIVFPPCPWLIEQANKKRGRLCKYWPGPCWVCNIFRCVLIKNYTELSAFHEASSQGHAWLTRHTEPGRGGVSLQRAHWPLCRCLFTPEQAGEHLVRHQLFREGQGLLWLSSWTWVGNAELLHDRKEKNEKRDAGMHLGGQPAGSEPGVGERSLRKRRPLWKWRAGQKKWPEIWRTWSRGDTWTVYVFSA